MLLYVCLPTDLCEERLLARLAGWDLVTNRHRLVALLPNAPLRIRGYRYECS